MGEGQERINLEYDYVESVYAKAVPPYFHPKKT